LVSRVGDIIFEISIYAMPGSAAHSVSGRAMADKVGRKDAAAIVAVYWISHAFYS